MVNTRYNLRPECSKILSEFNLWGIQEFTESQMKSNNYLESLGQMKLFSNQFFINYFEDKVNNIKQNSTVSNTSLPFRSTVNDNKYQCTCS